MVRRYVSAVILGVFCVAAVVGCHSGKSPTLRVIGAQKLGSGARHEIVFVQVTNPASRPMRLTKLEYTFASHGSTVSEGELPLWREVPAGAAVVVEIPLDPSSGAMTGPMTAPMTLRGKLTAELDQIVRIFAVSAQIQPR